MAVGETKTGPYIVCCSDEVPRQARTVFYGIQARYCHEVIRVPMLLRHSAE